MGYAECCDRYLLADEHGDHAPILCIRLLRQRVYGRGGMGNLYGGIEIHLVRQTQDHRFITTVNTIKNTQMNIRTFLLMGALSTGITAWGQTSEPMDSSYANGYYVEQMKFFDQLHPPKNAVVFLGNSITEVGPWSDVLPGVPVVNRGISGDNSFGVVARLDKVLAIKPRKIFLMIGVNDIKRGTPLSYIVANYERIIVKVLAGAPKTTLYLQSVLPVTEPILANIYAKINNQAIRALNDSLKTLAVKYHCTYVDLHNDVFAGDQGLLKRELTTDGLHLKHAAYILWADYLKKKKYL